MGRHWHWHPALSRLPRSSHLWDMATCSQHTRTSSSSTQGWFSDKSREGFRRMSTGGRSSPCAQGNLILTACFSTSCVSAPQMKPLS